MSLSLRFAGNVGADAVSVECLFYVKYFVEEYFQSIPMAFFLFQFAVS